MAVAREAHRMASSPAEHRQIHGEISSGARGANMTPHPVIDGYPGPRSATWLRQLTHCLGIVTAERGITGATRYPSAQTGEIRGTP